MRFAVGAGMACITVLAIVITMSLLVMRSHGPASPREGGRVQVVDGGSASMPPAVTAPGATAPIAAAEMPADDGQHLVTLVTARFPVIREGRIECDLSCKLILALGDQSQGPSPFDGALERYLSEQGYTLTGPLVVDQAGDNDTLLTLPLHIPMEVSRIGGRAGVLPMDR
ncbi:hypothetical protein [Sphingomonas sp. 1185]|uniref:hypothetical protein n=1 Tax=Sphingomonas sp. 1185 TaxID=3156411 RepID=UPI003391518F